MKPFTFLVSSERSGSNLVRSLLDGHPSIAGPPPSHLFRLFVGNRANYGDLRVEGNWLTLTEDLAHAFDCKLGRWLTSISAAELRRHSRERSVADLLRVVYEREAAEQSADQIFVKENHTYRFAPFLLAHFPAVRFVVLTRDPRDVAASWARTSSVPGGVERAVDVWREDQEGALELHDQLCDAGRVTLIRYEDLISETETVLEDLTTFLGVPYDPVMLRFNEQRRTRVNARRIEAWANLRRPVISENQGKFRDQLSREDVEYVELLCGAWMDRLGYRREEVTGELLPAEERMERAEGLRERLSPGVHRVPDAEERTIRERRLRSIERVLRRRL